MSDTKTPVYMGIHKNYVINPNPSPVGIHAWRPGDEAYLINAHGIIDIVHIKSITITRHHRYCTIDMDGERYDVSPDVLFLTQQEAMDSLSEAYKNRNDDRLADFKVQVSCTGFATIPAHNGIEAMELACSLPGNAIQWQKHKPASAEVIKD